MFKENNRLNEQRSNIWELCKSMEKFDVASANYAEHCIENKITNKQTNEQTMQHRAASTNKIDE